MNSKITHSKLHKNLTFKHFGMKFAVRALEETRSKWERVYRHPDTDTVIDVTQSIEDLQKLLGDKQPVLKWEDTGKPHVSTHVISVDFMDEEDCRAPRPVELVSTLDGPILGIVYEETPEETVLMDPCIVRFDEGKISYHPIFNVARKLRLSRAAIRSRQAPAEIILASYPGFILENRMAKYQLKAPVPMASSVELDTDADEPVTAATTH